MTIPRAISILRKKTGISQRDFALRIGATVETVSRWENGHRKPIREALRKLAEIAESAHLSDIHDFFERQRSAGIAANIKNLPSAGTQRRVPLVELKRWQAMPRFAAEQLEDARKVYTDVMARLSDQDLHAVANANRLIWTINENVLKDLSNQIELYINPKRKEKASVRSR